MASSFKGSVFGFSYPETMFQKSAFSMWTMGQNYAQHECLHAKVFPCGWPVSLSDCSNSYYRTGEAAFFPLSQIPRLSFANKQLCCFGPWTVWIIRWCGKGEDKYTVPPETQTV